jgi:tetratricopeptide (TPR) repeat protein
LYRAIWDGLPPKSRELCMMAVLSTPKSVSADWGSGEDRWDRDVVIDAVASIEWLRDRLEKFGSKADDESHGWVRQVTDWLYRFHEPVQYRIALEAAADNHTDESLRQYRWEIAKKLDPTQENFERALHNATLLVALRAEGITEADDAWRAGILLIVETLASLPDVESARSLILHASELIDSVSEDLSSILRARRLRASAYSAIGDTAKAIAQFQEVLVDQIDLLGPEHPETLETHNDLAVAIRKNGEPDRALELHRDILLIRSRTLNPDHPKVLLTRNNIARCLSEIGSHEDALNEFRNLYDDKVRILGPHDESTLITRGNLAVALRKSGQLEDAVVEFRELLEDRKRLLGDNHPSTLLTRGNLAHALRVGGRFDEAISEYEALLRDRRRVLGVDHPKTLLTHHNLAVAMHKGGRVEDALAELRAVAANRSRVLGSDHPETVKTRRYLDSLSGE